MFVGGEEKKKVRIQLLLGVKQICLKNHALQRKKINMGMLQSDCARRAQAEISPVLLEVNNFHLTGIWS